MGKNQFSLYHNGRWQDDSSLVRLTAVVVVKSSQVKMMILNYR